MPVKPGHWIITLTNRLKSLWPEPSQASIFLEEIVLADLGTRLKVSYVNHFQMNSSNIKKQCKNYCFVMKSLSNLIVLNEAYSQKQEEIQNWQRRNPDRWLFCIQSTFSDIKKRFCQSLWLEHPLCEAATLKIPNNIDLSDVLLVLIFPC